MEREPTTPPLQAIGGAEVTGTSVQCLQGCEVPQLFRRTVPVADVKVASAQLDLLDTTAVKLLAQIMARYGQRYPITVTADLELISGAKSFAAALVLGWRSVDVDVLIPGVAQ
jgi:hypothetical protein